jgi:hypothetical protein
MEQRLPFTVNAYLIGQESPLVYGNQMFITLFTEAGLLTMLRVSLF